jgi:hypothetical protein
MVVAVMEALVAVGADLHTMFQVLGQVKATVEEVDKLSTKAALHQTATAMHVLAATALLTQAVVVAAVDHIMVAADQASLS